MQLIFILTNHVCVPIRKASIHSFLSLSDFALKYMISFSSPICSVQTVAQIKYTPYASTNKEPHCHIAHLKAKGLPKGYIRNIFNNLNSLHWKRILQVRAFLVFEVIQRSCIQVYVPLLKS